MTHHRWQSHSGQFDGVQGCIQTALMHKKHIHLCTRLVLMSICFKDFAFTKKSRRCLLLSQVFAPRQPSVGVCFNFALFAPRVSCQAAQYRCQSVILNTHRDKPAQLWKTLCAPSEKQQLQDLRGWRRGGRAVVNCESKTINRVSRRSGAWCMDELLLLLEQKHINWIACLSPGRHHTHRV